MTITCNQLEQQFLDFFKTKEHVILQSAPIVPQGDDSLLFVNAGMVQFKDMFTGIVQPMHARVATSQKCLRVGGKHNDIEQIGFTKRHHTFFKMLGNFSFGDYFKEEAIVYAWEFITQELKLDKSKLYATVHEQDDQSFAIWSQVIGADRVTRLKGNFWSMGETGPCGYCTEIFYDLGTHLQGDFEDGDRYLEVWNLVFMEYERSIINGQAHLHDLESKCVDTGIGLERMTAVLNHLDDTFLLNEFQILIRCVSEHLHLDLEQSRNRPACKILADHARSIAMLLCEGVAPGNEGREYVTRKLIRRCARFIYSITGNVDDMRVLSKVIDLVAQQFSEVNDKLDYIKSVLSEELERFAKVLVNGMTRVESLIEHNKTITGRQAFDLYQTYGFPLEITTDIAKEYNLQVNTDEYHRAEQEHRELAQKSWKGVYDHTCMLDKFAPTEFIGYEQMSCNARVIGILQGGCSVHSTQESNTQGHSSANEDDEFILILDQTPFYGEGGGQTGDIGELYKGLEALSDADSEAGDNKKCIAIVTDTKITNGIYMHYVKACSMISVGDEIICQINMMRRKNTAKHHTGAHLLNYALHQLFGDHISQRGSLVTEDKLRLDFSHHKAVTKEELSEIENIVNSMIEKCMDVDIRTLPFSDVVACGAVTCPGEKYPEYVRTININNQSIEPCCGTHVVNTEQIGLFKIVKESSISAGTRRIEAVCGQFAYKFLQKQLEILDQSCELMSLAQLDQLPVQIQKLLSKPKKAEQITAKVTDFQLKNTKGLLVMAVSDDKNAMKQLSNKHKADILIIIVEKDDKQTFLCKTTTGSQYTAKQIGNALTQYQAKFGGNDLLVQGSFDHKVYNGQEFMTNIIDVLKNG